MKDYRSSIEKKIVDTVHPYKIYENKRIPGQWATYIYDRFRKGKRRNIRRRNYDELIHALTEYYINNYDYYDGWLDDPNCWNAGDATNYQASLACDKESGKNDDNTIDRHKILHPNTTYYLLLEGKAGDSISVTVKKIPMKIEKRKIKPAFAKKTVKKKLLLYSIKKPVCMHRLF